jgi:hypothetical protein
VFPTPQLLRVHDLIESNVLRLRYWYTIPLAGQRC